jgi:hypothetical protein
MSFEYEIDSYILNERETINEINLLITPSIKDFLNIEKDTKYFIIAPKGFGKTLFLKYKRIKYEEKYRSESGSCSVFLIPENKLIDERTIYLDYDWEQERFLSNEDTWRDVWLLAILLSVIKNIQQDSKRKHNEDYILIMNGINEANLPRLMKLIKSNSITPYNFLEKVLNSGHNKFFVLKNELNSLLSIIRGKRISTAIFLEEIDIKFTNKEKTPDKNTFQNILKLSQIGLMSAVRDLSNINQHIKVFSCISSESYMQMRQTNEFSLQMGSNIQSINYSKNELKEIINKKIKSLNKETFVRPKLLHKNPIFCFLGLDKLSDNYVDGGEEKVFDYIYRHTIKRPVDLILLIDELKNLDIRNEENVKKVINEKATEIVLGYIKDTMPYLTINQEDLERLFTLLNKNIISFDEIQMICSEFNNKTLSTERDCTKSSKIPIFVELYNMGLLGILENYETGEFNCQSFLQPGELFGVLSTKHVPQSPMYFIHPALYREIKRFNSKFEVNKEVIVGDKSPYKITNRDED